MDNLEIDYKKAAQQLRSGEALFGKDGALAPLLERILNSALEGEMDAHLSEEERSSGNRRNGKMSKKVQTKYGEVTIETPRDRDGTFQPETVKKRETILANGMADQIIEMYAMGTSTRDISSYFEREVEALAVKMQAPNQLAAVLLVSGSPDENLPYTLMPPMRPTTAPMA